MQRTHLLALCLAAAGALAGPGGPVLGGERERDSLPLGFSSPAWDAEQAIEKQFASLLDRTRISRTHRQLTREPHRAGTEGAQRVALYIRQEAEKAGFKPEVTSYLFYGSHPGPRSIALTAPIRKPLSLAEEIVPGDPFTQRPSDHLGFCAYSGSGTVEGDVVYAGQGTVQEFRALEERGVDLKGRIVLMRYFGEGEGRKVLRAQAIGRDLASATGRLDVVQVRVRDGVATPVFGLSALLSVLTAADGYVIVPEEATGLDAGTEVEVTLYR